MLCGKVTLFTGAPDAYSLQWDEEELSVSLLPCFSSTDFLPSRNVQLSNERPLWRSIPLERQHLPTGLTPNIRQLGLANEPKTSSFDGEETSFLDTNDLSSSSTASQVNSENLPPSSEGADELLTQFYEHSFALHEGLPSSQIVEVNDSNDTSFLTASSSYVSSQDANTTMPLTERAVKPSSVHLSDLEDIPNAAYLRSINPQTMTVNLIVGIISMPPPRTIRSRKDGRTSELIEVTVGDETKAGFGINIWLPSSKLQSGYLRAAVSDLRPQDIILVRNVALSSFRGNVYGQSLRKDMTNLDLLYRNTVDRHDPKGAYSSEELDRANISEPQIAKVKRVKDWVMMFVGGRPKCPIQQIDGIPGRVNQQEKNVQVLPEDTQ